MKSNYRPIGEFIRLVDERNRELNVTTLLGVTNSKKFIPSVANVIGTDLSNYKIIRKNQFACSIMQVRRDGKMAACLLKDLDEAIMSPAYPIFEVIDPDKLLPEYMMMWLTRSEFDREACFYAVGGVRGSLEWEDFCGMKLPIPSITKQREIVKEYNLIQNRIALNQKLIQKLEETAQAIYKQWFVDFEFPDENEQPYKSSGGEMIWNEGLEKELPRDWKKEKLANLTLKITDGTHSTVLDDEYGEYYLLSCKNIKNNDIIFSESDRRINKETLKYLRKRTGLQKFDILVTTVGTIGEIAQIKTEEIPYELQRSVAIIRTNTKKISHQFLYQFAKSNSFKKQVINKSSGSVQTCLFLGAINDIDVIIPNLVTIEKFDKCSEKINQLIELKNKELLKLNEFNIILLSKLATIEN